MPSVLCISIDLSTCAILLILSSNCFSSKSAELSTAIPSYRNISLNCFSAIVFIEYFKPKPVTISAVQPATPTIVIKKRFLYLSKFLTVTFARKSSRFHIKFTRSNKTRLPFCGGFGRISCDGCDLSSLIQA